MGESSHDHKHEHEHEHDHKHEHKHEHEHDHKHEHDHDHEPKDKKAKLDTDDKNDAHDHSHSHAHGEDCHECGPKVLEADSMSEEPVPEWKKNALKEQLDPSAAPFGGNWTLETSVSATKDAAPKSIPSHAHDHGHSHEHMDHPGNYSERPTGFMNSTERDYKERAFTVGLGGPVGSGKTALMLALCHKLRDQMSVGAVTNDIFTREDGEFLTRHEALPKERIRAVETGGCPHAAIREDISANLHACEVLTASFTPLDIILLESGGDNLAANFSPELADFTIYVIDVAGGDKVPRKGGPGVTQSDVLVINKTDLAEAVGASLDVMKRDSKKMRGDGPTVFAQAKEGLGKGVDEITKLVLDSWKEATKPKH